jgi:hypothetical protein
MIINKDPKQKQLKKFRKIDEDWRISQNTKDAKSLKDEVCKVAINTIQLAMAEKFDPDLNDLKEKMKTAKEPYSEGKKINTLKMSYIIELLSGMGEDVPSIEDFLKQAANGETVGQE